MNAYFYVYKLRELISPKLNWFQSTSVNSEIIILSCAILSAPIPEEARTGTINALHRTWPGCYGRERWPNTRTRGLARARAYVRTYTYACTKVYAGREHGREEKKSGERTLVCLYDVIEFMCGTSISEALLAAQHRAPRLLWKFC